MTQPSDEQFAQTIAEALNCLGVLALPSALETLRGHAKPETFVDGAVQAVDALLAILASRRASFRGVRITSEQLEEMLRSLRASLVTHDLEGPELIERARAIIDALGMGPPRGWLAWAADLAKRGE